ncbi:nuclear transport factor 2-like [Impatiens glandulifera]|uniref:nuclear transport factor 2-like n=1 Tax=Impatiens glandulifera TaxID=253017 RepID=UPI001FB0707C|nr:nuclear transport factor 2-like [Impatiens glandulifera]
MAEAVEQPVSAQMVGNAFVQQYYQILHQSPALVHRFYQNISQLGRPADDGTMTVTTNMEAINEKILSLNYNEIRPEIKTVDAQESYNGGVHVLVTGCHEGNDNLIRNFTQSFFLAPQEKGYFVFSDMFRYILDVNHVTEINVSSNNEEATLTPSEDSSPVENGEIEVPINDDKEISIDAADNREVVVVEEEAVPVSEVVDEVPDESREKVEPDTKVEDVPKKSYASIVRIMKESKAPITSPPPAAPRRNSHRIQEKHVNHVQASVPATEVPLSGPDATEDGNNQEAEGDSCSIYIKGLPFNATPALLEEEFKRFGTIRSGGIQVRSNKVGFCFGFVEFEVSNAVVKALEASPIMIGGRQTFVEEKRSPYNSRLNNNRVGRFQGGRGGGGGSGFKNEGPRGGAGGGRGGYFNGRSDFVNKGGNGNRGGGFSNRGGSGGPAAAARATTPRISATA